MDQQEDIQNVPSREYGSYYAEHAFSQINVRLTRAASWSIIGGRGANVHSWLLSINDDRRHRDM